MIDALKPGSVKLVVCFVASIAAIVFGLYKLFRNKPRVLLNIKTFYLLLMCIYILIEVPGIVKKIINDTLPVAAKVKPGFKPDVYMLVFDEYASSKALLNYFNYNNSRFDTFLQSNHFIEIAGSKSNYNYTMFSLASTLNYSYLNNIDSNNITESDYLKAFSLIKNSAVQSFFETNGYSIKNYSFFNLSRQAPSHELNINSFGKSAIQYQTIEGRLGTLLDHRFGTKEWNKKSYHNEFNEMKRCMADVQKESLENRGPKFIYMHILAPHPPSYVDSNGNFLSNETAYRESLHKTSSFYTSYLAYWNNQIQTLVSSIITHTKNKAVIIVMGDHGYRKYDLQTIKNQHHFMNMLAIHFPLNIQPKGEIPETLINLYPFIFNSVFNTDFKYQPDRSVFLQIKGDDQTKSLQAQVQKSRTISIK